VRRSIAAFLAKALTFEVGTIDELARPVEQVLVLAIKLVQEGAAIRD